ncbi:Glycosyl transferase family 8 [Musa troglodytarum]|uniref:Regulatory protein RecX n=1 Tax=Musa troglodytarum TaxID=320322 RepID=A0A9E7JWH9_9LILI|nr:Glycosyl transferase family 8 [Musa troglodytarum]
MTRRRLVLALLCLTVLSPIVLYTDRLSASSNPSSNDEVGDEASSLSFGTNDVGELRALAQVALEFSPKFSASELTNSVKEPIGVVYSDNSNNSNQILTTPKDGSKDSTAKELPLGKSEEHKSRVLSVAVDERSLPETEGVIKEVTDGVTGNNSLEKPESAEENKEKVKIEETGSQQTIPITVPEKEENKFEEKVKQVPPRNNTEKHHIVPSEKKSSGTTIPDARVRQLKDQLIRAKVYLSIGPIRSNPHFVRELRLRIKDVQRALGDATKDSDLPRNAYERLKAMELTLAKGKQIQDDCAAVVKKLRAMVHSSEEQLRVHKKQSLFLAQLAAKTIPKGLHCLPLRLSAEYFSMNSSQRQFPYEEKLEDPDLFHYALFSDNVLATAVVVNSTVSNAKNPADHVFHIVTDRLNYAAMRMWFLANPPGKAAIQVQNIEEFTWLNDSYSPVLKQLRSQSMIDYYFRTHHATANSDANLKYRNPKYLSILNHLRFYLPEVFPKLHKVVFLDDDVVVQRDLTGLWEINMKGKVNGAIETCGESFHRFDKYLNFSSPLIAKRFNPRSCGWAYGMNVFDLDEWRRQKVTEVYHYWQNLQKIVIKINVICDRCRNKALKLASSVRGVESVAIQGRNRNRVVVTGEGVDSVYLTSILRKKMGYAEIICISRVNIDEVQECEEPGHQEVPQCYDNYCGPPQMMSNGVCNTCSNVPDSASASCPNLKGKLLRQEKMATLLANRRFQISLHGQFRCLVISSWVKNRRDSSGRVRCIPGEYAMLKKAAKFSHLKTAKEKETYPTEIVSSKNIKFHGNFSRNNHPDEEGASSSGIFDGTEELLEFKDVSSYSLDIMEDAAKQEFELCPVEEQDSDISKITETEEVMKSRIKQDAEQMAIELLSGRGLINDGLYAESFSHSRWLSSTWGPKRIKKALRHKGVNEKVADKATKEVFEEDDTGGGNWNIQHGMSKHSMERLYLQASKQWFRSQDSSPQIRKSRIVRWLQYRGFSWGITSNILRRLESDYPP